LMTNEPHTWCTMIYVAGSRDVAGLRKGATIRLTAPAYWKVPSRFVLEFDGAVSGWRRIRGQAARSIG
jgi:hypothetical protein